MSGPKPKRPPSGKNGPGDGGKHDGVKHGAARKPKGGKLPVMTGTRG
jgi:hypothetical protein